MPTCPDCRATVPDLDGPTHPYMGTSAGCWALYGELLAREYGDPRWFAAHRLTVDAYAAQHPGRIDRRASQSVTIHLIALHLTLERGSDASYVRRVLSTLVARNHHQFPWIEPPSGGLGAVTVVDVLAARTPEEHLAAVQRWARSVYDAWSPRRADFLRYFGDTSPNH